MGPRQQGGGRGRRGRGGGEEEDYERQGDKEGEGGSMARTKTTRGGAAATQSCRDHHRTHQGIPSTAGPTKASQAPRFCSATCAVDAPLCG